MTLGYLGLRYIELSVSSPSAIPPGALVARDDACVPRRRGLLSRSPSSACCSCASARSGIGGRDRGPRLRAARRSRGAAASTPRSFLALALPVAYCLLDAARAPLRTTACCVPRPLTGLPLDECSKQRRSANCAYELTFLFAAVVCFVYVVLIRRDRLIPKGRRRSTSARSANRRSVRLHLCHRGHRAPCMSAIISSYCAASVLWSRLFLRKSSRGALRDDRSRGHRHRHHGRVRRIKKTKRTALRRPFFYSMGTSMMFTPRRGAYSMV